jgi:hypothetical protein
MSSKKWRRRPAYWDDPRLNKPEQPVVGVSWTDANAFCGEVIDPVILKNRRAPAPNLLYGTKQRKYGQRVVPIDSTRKRASDVSTDGQPDSEEA